jgi:hypothetical protein
LRGYTEFLLLRTEHSVWFLVGSTKSGDSGGRRNLDPEIYKLTFTIFSRDILPHSFPQFDCRDYSSSTMSSSTLSVDATTPLLQSVSEAAGRYVNGEALPKSDPEHAVQKWHNPIINAWRVLAAFFSFIVVGANDAIYGVRPCLPLPVPRGFCKACANMTVPFRPWSLTYVK